ncbi:MAG: glycosyltransferase family 4 protein [Magnetococcales bacterium]|nr:glycosyltransferase family 4 protein [Magnetococcales bacterium]
MRLALIADVFPPQCSSGAVQIRDLALEFARQGHRVAVMVPSPELTKNWEIESWNGVEVVRLRALPTTGLGYVRRTIGELLMPFLIWYQLRRSPLRDARWDGVVWYSPTIFHAPLVHWLKSSSRCKGYLIIRDIFPEWAVDMGIMGRGLPYLFFKVVASYQYFVADVIGIQSPGNRIYFKEWTRNSTRRVEVLQNWLADGVVTDCSIRLSETKLAGRKVFVYAGNMGVAQGMGILLDLAERLRVRSDIGFLFVGRGSEAKNLAQDARARGLDHVLFHDEIHPDEIPGLYAQCQVGLIALDPRHRSHNIPGKFLTYMQSGLPVLATINPGNDLAGMIRQECVGKVSEQGSVDVLERLAVELLDSLCVDPGITARCRALYVRQFTPDAAVSQIVLAFGAVGDASK